MRNGAPDFRKPIGYTYEEYKTMILPMALNGAEAVSAMGADSAAGSAEQKASAAV